ncbi:MAG: BACON domain-containing carbohydrate-binding protein [Blastocatellia bacterium]
MNSSPIPRAGFIIVAGQTFIAGQAGTGATCGLTPINIGQTVNGALVNTDCRSPIYGPNFYADLWYFTAKAGQQVAIQMNSSELDAYLTLIGPQGDVLADDDDGGGGTNSRLPVTNGFVTLPQDGTYIIEASSAFENELGKYTLSLTAPAGCTFVLSPTSQSIAANGGSGSVNVTSQTNCPWTAASNGDWITITSGANGSGSGVVNYAIAANTGTSSRIGTITIAGQTFTVTQAANSSCTFALAPTSQTIAAGGSIGSVNVTSQAGCKWTAVSNADWITINSGASGSGNGAVNFAVATNSGTARTGTLTIAGQTFIITQAANASCTYALTPTSRAFDNNGGSGNANVTTAAGCAWTASSNAAWISLQTGSESGNGNGSFGYSVALNTSSAARSGTITLGGQSFTITQSGAGAAACVDVALSSSLIASAGSTLTVPITVSDLTGKGALSFDATITFAPNVLRLQSTPVDRTGTLSSAMTVTVNTSTPGQIRISAFNAAALSGAGTLLNLKFDVIGANGACSNLNWTSFRFNEGTPCATTTNGRACVGSSGNALSGTVSYCVSPKPGQACCSARTARLRLRSRRV